MGILGDEGRKPGHCQNISTPMIFKTEDHDGTVPLRAPAALRATVLQVGAPVQHMSWSSCGDP